MSEKEIVEISEDDIMTVVLLGDEESDAEPVESAPTEQVAKKVADYSPLENEKVLSRVRSLHNAIMKLKDVDYWRNDGTSKYLAYFVPPKRSSIFGIHLNKNRARGTLKQASEDGKKNLGDVGIKISESGIILNDKPITQKEVLAIIRQYRKARGWV